MKSYLDLAVTVYGGIISDAIHRWPMLRSSLEKDFSYLLRASQTRGLGFFTITLPQVDKALCRALDAGDLSHFKAPQGFPWSSTKGPELFRDLFAKIFDERGTLRSGPDDVDAVLFLRQLLCCCKKMKLACASSKTLEVIDEFFEIEDALPRSHEDTWDSDVPVWRDRHGHPLWGVRDEPSTPYLPGMEYHDNSRLPWNNLRAFTRRVVSELGSVDWWDLRPKHGPGVVSDKSDGLKYEQRNWPRKLGLWFPYDWYGSGLLEGGPVPTDREPPSRLIAVPKSQKGPRLICAEPTSHQWMQQSIWRWLEGAIGKSNLLRRSIDFRSQETQRKLALNASMGAEHATIDLSSASDRLSTRLVEFIFQGHEILEGFHASRTRLLIQNISHRRPSCHLLRKFSTQGSAITFPVQTIVFTILAVWALRLHEGSSENTSTALLERDFDRVHVFGDDIIAPADALEAIKLVFHECGLKINVDKTYGGENFRESCGMDAYKGHNVTPAYILQPYDGSPSSMASVLESSNNFHTHGFWRAAEVLMDVFPNQELKLLRVVGVNDGHLGLTSFCGSHYSHLPRKWDRELHRWYTESLGITQKVVKRRGQDSASLSQYFFECRIPM